MYYKASQVFHHSGHEGGVVTACHIHRHAQSGGGGGMIHN